MRQGGGVQFEGPAVDAENLEFKWSPFWNILNDFMEVISRRFCLFPGVKTYEGNGQFESGKRGSSMMQVAELLDIIVGKAYWCTNRLNTELSESRKPAKGYYSR